MKLFKLFVIWACVIVVLVLIVGKLEWIIIVDNLLVRFVLVKSGHVFFKLTFKGVLFEFALREVFARLETFSREFSHKLEVEVLLMSFLFWILREKSRTLRFHLFCSAAFHHRPRWMQMTKSWLITQRVRILVYFVYEGYGLLIVDIVFINSF